MALTLLSEMLKGLTNLIRSLITTCWAQQRAKECALPSIHISVFTLSCTPSLFCFFKWCEYWNCLVQNVCLVPVLVSICFNIVPGDTAHYDIIATMGFLVPGMQLSSTLTTMASKKEVSMEPHPFPLALSLLKQSCKEGVCCWERCGKVFPLQWSQ